MAEYRVEDSSLTSVARAIRAMGGTSEPLEFPNGFVEAIYNLEGGDGVGLQMVLLWENASPTSDFAEQTIALDLSPYDIIAVLGDGVHAFISHPFTAGKEGVMSNWVAWGTGLSYQHSGRVVAVSADDAGLTFGPGRLIRQNTGSVENNNSVAKPQKIYGIRRVTE